ncbi:MAG: hypothetical protein NVS2B2_38340 [Ktedonobacteraceae bacterium]
MIPFSLRSMASYTSISISIAFNNFSSSVVDTYWVNFQGDEVHYNQLGPGQSYSQQTYVSHPWRIKD